MHRINIEIKQWYKNEFLFPRLCAHSFIYTVRELGPSGPLGVLWLLKVPTCHHLNIGTASKRKLNNSDCLFCRFWRSSSAREELWSVERFPVIETKMSFIDPYQHIIVSHLLFICSLWEGTDIFLSIGIVGFAGKALWQPLDLFMNSYDLNVVQIGYNK